MPATNTPVPVDSSYYPNGPEQLARAVIVVNDLITGIRADQWAAPTPCSAWTVRELIAHLIGMNQVFVASLEENPIPQRSPAPADEDLAGAFADSAAALQVAFARPGVLEHTYVSPLGAATGAERLQIRLYDLLAHGWDLARASGQPAAIPDDLAEQALAFVRGQLNEDARPGRFAPAQPVPADAPAVDRLAAFLGRPVDWGRDH